VPTPTDVVRVWTFACGPCLGQCRRRSVFRRVMRDTRLPSATVQSADGTQMSAFADGNSTSWVRRLRSSRPTGAGSSRLASQPSEKGSTRRLQVRPMS
jgi:hypothetical protein